MQWAYGVVPNAPDADVVIPTITTIGTGAIYIFDVDIQYNQAYHARSMTLANNVLAIGGVLTADSLARQSGGGVALMTGGTLDVADARSSIRSTGFNCGAARFMWG